MYIAFFLRSFLGNNEFLTSDIIIYLIDEAADNYFNILTLVSQYSQTT